MIKCTKCQGEGWYFKGTIFTFCEKCDGSGAVETTIFHPVAEYFLFTQPWRRMLLWAADYLPGNWGSRLSDRLYPSEPKMCRDCFFFEGCMERGETTEGSGAARCDYFMDGEAERNGQQLIADMIREEEAQ